MVPLKSFARVNWRGTIWFYITAITVIIGAIISIVVPLFFLPGATEGTGGGITGTPAALNVLDVLTTVLYVLAYTVVVPFAQVMFLQTTVSFGSLLAGKSHIFASIGFYFGVNFALSTITSMVSNFLLVGIATNSVNYSLFAFINALIYIGIYIGLFIGMYCWNIHLLKNKVNLE